MGPIVEGPLTEAHRRLLASSYEACLDLAAAEELESLAFCCISTGVFGFPQEEAADMAIGTVRDFLKTHEKPEAVVFIVFTDRDLEIYKKKLATGSASA